MPSPAPSNAFEPHFIVAVERVVNLTGAVGSVSAQDPFPKQNLSGLGVNLLGVASASANNPFAVPVLSLHAAVLRGLTLGGAIGYWSDTPTTELESGASVAATTVTGSARTFIFGPRIGYLFAIAPLVSIWAKAGLTYVSGSSKVSTTCSDADPFSACDDGSATLSDTSWHYWDLALDPALVVSLTPHFGILLGPIFDVALAGSQRTSQGGLMNEFHSDARLSSYGLAAGIAAMF